MKSFVREIMSEPSTPPPHVGTTHCSAADLPELPLQRVLSFLPSLGSALLVSREWRRAALDPTLPQWHSLSSSALSDAAYSAQFVRRALRVRGAQLRSLDLRGFPSMPLAHRAAGHHDALLAAVAETSPMLCELSLDVYSLLSARALRQHLPRLPRLATLALDGVVMMSDEFVALDTLPALRALRLREVSIAEHSIA